MLKLIKANIPNTITCLNLLAGCVAVILSFHLTETFGSLLGVELAFICIGAAAVFDFCDGLAARVFKAYSEVGKQLDSLSDLVSFGVAPAMILFNLMSYANGGAIASYVALFIPIFGALRLARFNVDDRQTTTFIGLPIPANAIFWIGMSAWMASTGNYPGDTAMILLVIGMSLLMVSPLKMFSLKFKNLTLRDNFRRYVIILAAVLFVIFNGLAGLAWTILLYIILSFTLRNREG